MKLFDYIKDGYNEWREQRFLKRYGVSTREQYERLYDPDYNQRATRIKDYYHGYPYIYCFEDHRHDIYFWDYGYDGTILVNKWCKENLNGKFRFDFLRAMKAPSTANQWEINELGGGDYIFFACQDPKDYTLFLLRWS